METENKVLFGNEKEQGADTYYNLHEPQKHYAEEPVTKDYMLNESFYKKCPE